MVGGGVDALRPQALGHLLDPPTAQAIDDAGLLPMSGQEPLQLLQGPALVGHEVTDVRPVEAGHEHPCVGEAQVAQYVLACLVVGGGRERDQRHPGEPPPKRARLHVLGTEVVTPLRHAVGFVDSQERERHRSQHAQEGL